MEALGGRAVLIGNYSVYHKLPDKFLTGTTLYGDRANFNKPGMMRSMGAGSGNDWTKAAIPTGFNVDGAWMLPKTGGMMVSRYDTILSFVGTGIGREGLGGVATSLIQIDGSAIGSLVAGAVGSCSFSINAEGLMVATLGTTGSAQIIITADLITGGLGWLVGDSDVSLDGSLVSYAIGYMEGTTVEVTAMTVDAIASAVWEAISASHNNSGTMGYKMNSAASAGDPWVTEMSKYTDDLTFGAFIKKLLTAGKWIALK